mgnify:FL=1
MSVGEPRQQALTIGDLPRLVAAVAAADPERVALTHGGVDLDYARFDRELAAMDTAMGGTLGPEALVPIVLSSALPGVVEATDGGFDGVVAMLLADAVGAGAADPATGERTDATLVSRFEAQVARTPDATALVYGNTSVTYAEFDARANRLARLLVERGVGPDVLVGLAIRRSLDLLVAMYAIVKAGGAYVPIDPDQPAERNRYVLATARPACLLTTSRDRTTDSPADVPVIDVDTADVSDRSPEPLTDTDRQAPLHADNLAYVIFTSGSTGRPKGVGVAHRAIVSNLDWRQREYAFTPEDVVIQKTPFTFDVSVWEFFWPLQVGASLVVAEPGVHRDPADLARVMSESGVTVAHFVPSMLSVFVAEPAAAHLPDLRYVFASGEALPAQTCARFRAISRAGLHNLYGPTEAAVDVTYHAVTEADRVSVPIGVAVADTDLLVLDDALRPVPDGVVGELYLAGVQLARGYVARQELTAERFVAHPGAAGGARVYRTGDLVRRRAADGALEYIGRSDFQVKVRGLRIELGEIESALLDLPSIAQAAVVVYADETVGDTLVGYVVPEASEVVDTDQLVRALGERLPDYMVPATYVVLDEFPLGASGKLDRRALPTPELATHSAEYREPATDTESAIAAVFADLTGADRVGADDEFFALGGNSLLATRAVARINAEYGITVMVADFFDASTVAAFARIVDRAIESGDGAVRPQLVAGPRPERVPLSSAQQRLWFLNRLDPGSAVDNIPAALRIRGRLDVPAFESAARDVVSRHETLRTVYPEIDGVGYQHILAADAVAIDLTPLDVDEDAVVETVTRLATDGFDVTVDVPLRLHLLRLAADDHVLVVVLHHISGDGFSIGPLTRDLLGAYSARAAGAEPVWSDLPVQYADYTIWQRALLGEASDPGSVVSRQLDYWRNTLGSLPSSIDLPTDRPRPAVASGHGAVHRFSIPSRVYSGVRAAAAAHRTTEFMVVHAALAVLLSRLSGGDDVAVGTPVAGRGEQVLDDLVGMFVNTLVLRTSVDPGESFEELLARTREVDLGAFAHADVPFERLVEELDPVRSQAHHPLFQVMLTFQNLGGGDIALPGLDVSGYEIDTGNAKFDLQLTLWEPTAGRNRNDGLSARFTYATDLFDESTVRDFGRRFVRILEALVAGTDGAVGDIALVDADELALLAGPVIGGRAPELTDATLVDRFETAVRAHPDAVAVRSGDDTISYADLATRVHRLAHHLIACGVGPESLVAVALPRSADLVVALLAVLEAGGGYLPVDPTYPADRIGYMLADARPACALSWSGSDVSFPESLPVVDIDGVDLSTLPDIAPTDTDRTAALRPSNTAYVIYTSGSTGRPKGVAVPHVTVTRLLANTEELYGFDETDVWTLFHSYAFDFSVWELWGSLAYGGTLVVVDYLTSRSPDAFRELVARDGVTVLNQTPSAFYQFAEADRAAGADGPQLSLEWVIFGGEALEPRRLAPWFARHGGRRPRLVNMYGITETTVHVSFREVPAEWAAAGAPSVIGGPLPGLRAYVLDRRLHPVPVGVAGEMYIAGGQVTRGYLGRPELTSARFVANPFADDGSLLYRTGDVARWTGDGELEYVGRADDQVKVRGFRIELGEIEAAVLAHPAVGDAAVIVREDLPGDQRIVAYVAPTGDLAADTLDPAGIGGFAARSLPEYMVPSHVVVLDAIPLTVNGKLDRRSLPAPEARVREFRAPRNRIERAVADVIAEVLGLDRVGLDDDFFDLGGNSLVATRVAARLGHELDTPVAVRMLFETSGVEALAAALEPLAGSGNRPAVVARDRQDRAPLSLAQRRMWLLNQLDTDAAGYNIPLVLRLTGSLDVPALVASLRDVVQRHEALRTMYPSDADGPYQQVLGSDAVAETVVESVSADEVPGRVASLVGRGFDVAAGVPIRSALLNVAADEHVLVLVVHHISADGESMAPLARDAMLAYAARIGGGAPAWPALTVQYADFALWQHDVIGDPATAGSVAAEQVRFWTDALAAAPRRAHLPTDRPRPAEPTGRGGVVDVTIAGPLHERLRETAREHRASVFMVVHAALAVVLSRLGGSADVVIGAPVAGRGDRALDDLVGMFVNTVALPVTVDPAAGFGALVERVRDADLAAFAHTDVPFEEVVDALGTQGTPFEVALSMEPAADARLELPGLSVSSVASGVPVAKFDLQLTLGTGPDGELGGTWLYSTDVFDEATVVTLTDRLTTVLTQATEDPEAPVGELDLMTEAERTLVLGAGSQATGSVSAAEPVDRRIAAAVEEDPDAPAVIVDGSELSYREIDEASSRLARLLLADGFGPGDRIGVVVEPTAATVVALWAVVKAEAAVVALAAGVRAEDPPACVIGRGAHEGAPSIDPGDSAVGARLAALSSRPIGRADRTAPAKDTDPAFADASGVLQDRAGFAAAIDASVGDLGLDYESRLAAAVSDPAHVARWILLAAVSGAAVVLGDTSRDAFVDLLADEWVSHALVGEIDAARVREAELPDLDEVVTPDRL